MKTSRFNIWVDEDGKSVLYNSLYGSLTICKGDEVRAAKHILADPRLLVEAPEVVSVLVSQKHLIDDTVDEIALITTRKELGVSDPNRLDVIIMPTMECNFACTYCYEPHVRSTMTNETEAAIKMWLRAEIPSHKVTLLNWFGGEPLIGYERILAITDCARRIAKESHVECIAHMTTNGYLLDKERVAKLVNVGIFDYQITLDGPPETHDKLRVLKSGKGTFDRIYANIVDLARADERVKISLRVNFNHTNLYVIPSLLDMFPQEIRSRLRVVFEPIFGDCKLSATGNLPAEEISQALADYYEIAKQLGYDVVLGLSGLHTGKLVYCYAERESQFIVNFNGDIHKCSVSDFDPKHRVGYIRGDGAFIREEKWNDWVDYSTLFEERCLTCSYLPLCMGGCRKTRLQDEDTGSFCALVPTNASYLLKQIAFGNLADTICGRANALRGEFLPDMEVVPQERRTPWK